MNPSRKLIIDLATKKLKMVGIRLRQLSIKCSCCDANAVATTGYLLDDSTGRPEGGECPHGQPNRSYSWICRWSQLSKIRITTLSMQSVLLLRLLSRIGHSIAIDRSDGRCVSYQTIDQLSNSNPSCMSIV